MSSHLLDFLIKIAKDIEARSDWYVEAKEPDSVYSWVHLCKGNGYITLILSRNTEEKYFLQVKASPDMHEPSIRRVFDIGEAESYQDIATKVLFYLEEIGCV
jgi:hypothetical protein